MNGFLRNVFGQKVHRARRMHTRSAPLLAEFRGEALEERVVLAAGATASAYLGTYGLHVEGTQSGDILEVRRWGTGLLRVRMVTNGIETNSYFQEANVRQIVIWGYGGNDKLDVGSIFPIPPSWQYGGEGNDVLIGGPAKDVLYGEGGHDYLYGYGGGDSLYGGTGNDVLAGDAGNDSLWGGDGNDQLGGGQDNDWISGEGGNDTITGDNGNDTLYGGAGNDILSGGAGIDFLSGMAGDDTLYSQDGVFEWVYGGSGSDRFESDLYNGRYYIEAQDFNSSEGDR